MLAECLRHSRYLDEMERDGLYEILAQLIGRQRNLISLEVLEALLAIVGKKGEGLLVNPLAFRHLFLDFSLWNETEDIQMAHLQQFFFFAGPDNQHRDFNRRMLHSIGIVAILLTVKALSRKCFLSFPLIYCTIPWCADCWNFSEY